MKVMLDFDLTMGVHQKDVDDGLALLYILGSPQLDLIGATTTFGNSTLDVVHSTADTVFRELGITDKIPLYKGAADPSDRISEAAEALVREVNAHPNEITLIGIGSLTNLLGAQLLDPDFFAKVRRVVLMGGITHPLIINDRPMAELNFSSDPEAAYAVLSSPAPVTVITGHLCLQALFTAGLYQEMIQTKDPTGKALPIFDYIREKTVPWLHYIGAAYDTGGFHNWDAVAALYVDHPEHFDLEILPFTATVADLASGRIVGNAPRGKELIVPCRIRDIDAFNRQLIENWSHVALPNL